MAHKYYCTYCGRELTQDTVLLDLEPALTGTSDKQFHVLKFRVKKQDFEAMLAGGTTGDMAFVHVDLTFEKFVEYLSDKNNLADPVIRGLKLEDISEFLDDEEKDEFGTNNEPDMGGMMNIFAPVGVPAKDEPKEDKSEGKVWSSAIEALRIKDTSAKDETKVLQNLSNDLRTIHNLFSSTSSVHLAIKSTFEKADDGTDVLAGYEAMIGTKTILVDARVCCHCDTKVFKHAGTAEHRSVAFIGEQESGKTSMILAMTNFAENAVRGAMNTDHIWKATENYEGQQIIEGIRFIELLSPSKELEYDLELYSLGYAPAKTEAKTRKNAYSATLWIKNSENKNYILTLMDLPGELCKNDGTIDGENIKNNFPVALACDVFIVCFDSTKAIGSKSNRIVCSWANEFQTLRRSHKMHATVGNEDGPNKITEDCFAPMMLLFNKCADLEDARRDNVLQTVAQKDHYDADQVKEIYSLKLERELIDKEAIYRDIGGLIKDYHNLAQAYYARLRTSPYGFKAPRYGAANTDAETGAQDESALRPKIDPNDTGNKNPDGTIKYPRPIHIRELMQWLLTVSGYIPADAVYCPNPATMPDHLYRPHDLYVARPQYRVKEPWGKSNVDALNEAVCRAYLFENYTELEKYVVENFEEILKGKSVEKVIKDFKREEDRDKDEDGGLTGFLRGLFGGGKKK